MAGTDLLGDRLNVDKGSTPVGMAGMTTTTIFILKQEAQNQCKGGLG
jgi:hypothetical protein